MRIDRAFPDGLPIAAAAFFMVCGSLACYSTDPVAPRTSSPDDGGNTGGDTSEPADPGPQQYQFGAKFEPPIGRVVHAQGQWKAYNGKYQTMLPSSMQPAAELSFIAIADTVRPWQPELIAAGIAALHAAGRIPSWDISLRGNQPTPAELALLPDKLFGVDDEIAHTSKHDSRILDLVEVAKQFGKPMMLRIGGEFNGPWNGYHPYDYPRAFRKIVNMFRAAGADNVAFVWCYEPAAPDDFDAANAQGEFKWFPGDDVIDWFSIDLFSAADVSGSMTGHGGSTATAFARTIRFLDMAVAHSRPVVIAESSPSHYDLSNPAQAVAAWEEWFSPYFGLIASRPEIKWFHYINYDWTQASYYESSGWKNNDLTASASLSQLYLAELSKPKYLHSSERGLLKEYGEHK